MDPWNTLVRLLSSNTLATLEADNGDNIAREFSRVNYDEVLALPGYEPAFTTLKALKRSVELIEERQDAAEVEIRLSLRVLTDEVRKGTAVAQAGQSSSNVRALESFIRKGMYQDWSEQEKSAFDLRVEVITGWVDYFISYTNRDAGGTNMRFEKLIRSAFAFFPKKQERTTINYVARAIAKYLEQNNLKGFTDAKSIRSGDDIEEKVFEYCRKAFAFAQLIEPETFTIPTAPKRNWCYEEFEEFVKPRIELTTFKISDGGKIFTVISADDIHDLAPANLGAFQDWFKAIENLKHIKLTGSESAQLREKIHEMAVLMLERKQTIIDALLAA